MTAAPRFSIVVPCYNEAACLPALLAGFASALRGLDAELVLVDNGSTDGTAAALAAALPAFPFARSVRVQVNRGYGHGILKGLETARGAWAGWTHADLQFDLSSVAEAIGLAAAAGEKNLFIKGSRRNRGAAERLFTSCLAAAAGLYLWLPLRDINGQPTLFRRELLADFKAPPEDFCFDLYAYALALSRGCEVRRFPVAVRPRAAGRSTWNFGLRSRLKLAAGYLKALPRIKSAL